jgi:hypothetical protein
MYNNYELFSLTDPRTGNIFWIGPAARCAAMRALEMCQQYKLRHCRNIVLCRTLGDILAMGVFPGLKVYGPYATKKEMCLAERHLIAQVRSEGHSLARIGAGGSGHNVPHSASTIARMRSNCHSAIAKPFRDLDTGKIYFAQRDALEDLGLMCQGPISLCLNGIQHTAGGHRLEFLSPEETAEYQKIHGHHRHPRSRCPDADAL